MATRTFACPKFVRVILALVVVKDFANEPVGCEAYRFEAQKAPPAGAEGEGAGNVAIGESADTQPDLVRIEQNAIAAIRGEVVESEHTLYNLLKSKGIGKEADVDNMLRGDFGSTGDVNLADKMDPSVLSGVLSNSRHLDLNRATEDELDQYAQSLKDNIEYIEKLKK
eukprot:TRINITY_DN8443_c0_g2_i1.p1 TRINITY_DN8443_c0_g2~~TRINITY_DN8443_c0_g2_i1.p1  ORF type:complete len:197 (+),score=39.80 TRINITY_DN8443_c0_g2_i1:90-593(+)